MDKDPDLLYKPEPLAESSPVLRFQRHLEAKYRVKFDGYRDMHRWSCENYDSFWGEVWEFCGVVHSKSYESVVDDKSKKINDVPKWFVGARLNYAENLLRRDDDKTAIYAAREGCDFDRDIKKLSFKELRCEVRKYAAALRAAGVKKGDRVAGYMPNCPECTIAMLATAAVGAVWSSTSTDFGPGGVLERFTQVKPTVLFSVDAVIYNGKVWSQTEKLKKVIDGLDTLQVAVCIPFIAQEENIQLDKLEKTEFLSTFLKRGRTAGDSYPPLEFEQVSFDHPLFIMFSSGTTGAPKCMVHSVGGTLLKHLEEHMLQECLDENDVLFFWTTVGWMMWNWEMSALASGAAIVLYDGSPTEPEISVLFDIVDKIGVTALGMGAKLYAVYEEKGYKPRLQHKLSTLRMFLSTGSPLTPASFDYIYRDIKKNAVIGSIAGGTDLIACFMGASMMVPVYRGQCQCLYLGMDCQAFDEFGKAVEDSSGELVCTKPFPSMPTHFLNDESGKKYFAAYFNKFPGVWAHGDHCIISSKSGGVVMLGRSDATLNPGGVRFGSADVYQVVETMTEVADSVCVGQRSGDGDERVVLFVKLANGYELDEPLVKKIKSKIRNEMSPKHVPAIIAAVDDIPYTTNGKKVEIAVRKVISGETVANKNALRNPESLDYFACHPALKSA